MITTNNATNSSKYEALFEQAFQFLVTEALENDHFPADLDPEERASRKQAIQDLVDEGRTRFTSVQEYFSHLQDLYWLGGKKFLMLPLDEPVFEIDANKREITVPAEFKKNGISVQGDEIAESLIFRINRFFDYSDLNEMDVKVQWENANKEEGVSSIFVVDDSKSADYLYLMWPLKEEITKYPGTVKFSLRFYERSGQELVYSFSTKVASATINAGHDFENSRLWSDVVDAESNFAITIKNSKNTAEEDAASPAFILNLDESRTAGENVEQVNENGPAGVRYEAYIDEDHPEQILRVQASSTDTGLMSYQWFYQDLLDTSTSEGAQYYMIASTEPTDIYLQSADTLTPTPYKAYYKKSGDDYIPSEFLTSEQMYEKYSVIKVSCPQLAKADILADPQAIRDVVGRYWCVAKNTVGSNSATTQSAIIEFPAPEVIEIADGGDLPDYAFMNASSRKDLVIEAIIDEYGAQDSYDWFYSPTGVGNWVNVLEIANASDREKVQPEGNILHVNGLQGYYYANVKSRRNYCDYWYKNGAWTLAEIPSNVCKLSPAIQAPVITYPEEAMALSSIDGPVTLEVRIREFTTEFESEGVTYQWYRWDGSDLIALEGETSSTLTVPQNTDDPFCCQVTNHIGDEIRIAQSNTFSVQRFLDRNNNTPEANPLPVNVIKLVVAPEDENSVEAQENQSNVVVTQNDNVITIHANDTLNSYTRGNEGNHEWVALDIDTGLSTITEATVDGNALDASKVAEAESVGLSAGHFIYWAKADELTIAARNITIGGLGYDSVTITVQLN